MHRTHQNGWAAVEDMHMAPSGPATDISADGALAQLPADDTVLGRCVAQLV